MTSAMFVGANSATVARGRKIAEPRAPAPRNAALPFGAIARTNRTGFICPELVDASTE